MTPKQCLNAGHRWGREMRADGKGFWVTIRRCHRALCDRLLSEDDTGKMVTYRMDDTGRIVDRKVIRRAA